MAEPPAASKTPNAAQKSGKDAMLAFQKNKDDNLYGRCAHRPYGNTQIPCTVVGRVCGENRQPRDIGIGAVKKINDCCCRDGACTVSTAKRTNGGYFFRRCMHRYTIIRALFFIVNGRFLGAFH